MSTEINSHVLLNYITKKIGSEHLTRTDAQKIGIDLDDYNEANADSNNYLDLDEILDNEDIYEHFATMYNEEIEEDKSTDAEKEKEEQAKVKDKNEAGV